MKYLISLFLALATRTFSIIFFRTNTSFVESRESLDLESYFEDISIFAFLNHTTLLEPLLFSSFPANFYIKNIKRVIIPGADITLSRPLVGRIYKFVFPQMISISRKRDHTWNNFIKLVKEDSLVIIAPEGRMKREDGLDKHGNPMSIRGGIADIILEKTEGSLLLGYSGGLHHVQTPGKLGIKLFQKIEMRFEKLNIKEYKQLLDSGSPGFKQRVVDDLTERLKQNAPNKVI